MSKTLLARIDELERKVEALKPPTPALICYGLGETDDEAKARFERERGYPFPACGLVLRFTIEDCSLPARGIDQ